MGQGSSKPPPSSTQHIFASETPVRFSQELVDALQASPEVDTLHSHLTVHFQDEKGLQLPLNHKTDSTRAKDLELHIQSRVASELSRLEAEQTQALKDLSDRISSIADPATDSTDPATQASILDQSNFATGGVDKVSKDAGDRLRDLGRQSVQKEIEDLKAKLQKRRVKEDVRGDEGVERARRKVVRCLRENDRRPLDCWEEVEGFKREVGRLEKGFLGKVLD